MIDLRQTPEYAKYMKFIGWVVERKDRVNYCIRKFPLIGSFIKIQRPEKIDLTFIGKLSKKYRALQIMIEPINKNQVKTIKNNGFRQSKSPFVPAKTIQIDLGKTQKHLLAEMHHKTRYNIKKTLKKSDLKTNISDDFKAFAKYWQQCAKSQRGMFLSQIDEITGLYKSFGNKADLVLIKKDDELLSGILMIRTDDIAYYMYAASSKKGKKFFAPTVNVWEAITLAKKRKCKFFDFEGIYDERFPLKTWQGFTRFKKSFGGKEIEYPGAYQKIRLPV